MKPIYYLALALVLSSCSTPLTTMKKGNSVVTCGGGSAGAIAGGFIGYKIQESNDADCVKDYASKGYQIVTPQPEPEKK